VVASECILADILEVAFLDMLVDMLVVEIVVCILVDILEVAFLDMLVVEEMVCILAPLPRVPCCTEKEFVPI
jgi:hypothetical protein